MVLSIVIAGWYCFQRRQATIDLKLCMVTFWKLFKNMVPSRIRNDQGRENMLVARHMLGTEGLIEIVH